MAEENKGKEEVQVPAEGEKKKLSKTEKKLRRKEEQKKRQQAAKEKAAKAAGGEKKEAPKAAVPAVAIATDDSRFCRLPLNKSQNRPGKEYIEIEDINENLVEKTVLVRARLYGSRHQSKNMMFLTLRHALDTIQVLILAGNQDAVALGMVDFGSKIPVESILDIEGVVKAANVASCTIQNVEIHCTKIFVVGEPQELPIQVLDCTRTKEETEATEKEEKENKSGKEKAIITVSRDHRLNYRCIEMRTPTNQAIWRINSKICQYFRDYLIEREFIEIHTPKLIGGTSEGGAEVFKVKYFDGEASLAQSPQLYKQMAIIGELGKVFEIAPVYRAEKSLTHRHLTEFIGLDMEMAFKEHYEEVLDVLGDMFISIFKRLKEDKKLLKAVNTQFPFEEIVWKEPTLRLKFKDAINILRDEYDEWKRLQDPENPVAKEDITDYGDLTTPAEKWLGRIVKEKYETDFYILDKFPSDVRPFYTMQDPDDPNYSNSYDFFLRGQEILSGAQRIHDYETLMKRAIAKEIDPTGIKGYLDAFKYGSPPHAGAGIGLERVVMLYLDLDDVKSTSMFPRLPNRLFP